MVTVEESVYKRMQSDLLFLECLLMAGVDNWDGYGYAQEMLEEAE